MGLAHSVRSSAALVAALTISCAAAPSAGASATPTASPAPSASAQPTAAPSVSPSAAPASAYLDDRSSAEQVIRSYYDAIGRRQYLRAYSYWESSATLPTFDVFEKGFADTSSVQVELGDRKSTRLNSSHIAVSRMPSSA